MQIESEETLSTRQAAAKLNKSLDWTRRRIKDGTLDGWQDDRGFWRVRRASVERLKDELITKRLQEQAYRP